MKSRVAWVSIGIVAGASAAALAQQDGAGGPDIVVEGAPLRMVAGLWTFQSSPILSDTPPGQRMPPPRPGQSWQRCITEGDTRAILDQLVGERAMFDGTASCSRLTLSIARNRVRGNRRCMIASPAGVAITRTTRLRARIAQLGLDADYLLENNVRGSDGGKMRWRVTARRVGYCAGAQASTPAPAPVPVSTPAEPLIRADLGRPEEPLPSGPQPGVTDQSPASNGARAPVPAENQAEARKDDIVVVARRLRVMRLHYASDGALFRWCHADTSSGDPRIDRIGCALVRACVREGNDATATVLGCYHRKVDTLDPVAAAGRGAGE